MIKVLIKNKQIVVSGHANYDDFGKDIVCASASSIIITSINACLKFDNSSLNYKEEKDKLIIDIKSDEYNIKLIINNMIDMLEELAETYNKNIMIVKEEDRWISWS